MIAPSASSVLGAVALLTGLAAAADLEDGPEEDFLVAYAVSDQSGLQIAAAILALLFALVTGLLGVYASRSADGIRFRAPSPLIGKGIRANEDAWHNAHRNAGPYLWTATVISFIQTLAFTVGALTPSLLGAGYLVVLALTGAVLIVILMVLAGRR